MNGYDLVQKWIDEGRESISENVIKAHGSTGRIALAILREEYHAKYVPSDASHFSGYYHFRHPRAIETKVYYLYSCFTNTLASPVWESFAEIHNYDTAIDEIIRLEFGDIWWHHSEQKPIIEQQIKKEMIDNVYHGPTRLWLIHEEIVWRMPK